jgi:ubiquinone biosynthesis accessory factor UbiJ
MVTSSPFSLPVPPLPPVPDWLQGEARRRVVSVLNHVLMQEPQAMERLKTQIGKSVLAQWREFRLGLLVTPAGLFDIAPATAAPALKVDVVPQSAMDIAQALLTGRKPDVRIEGDVQLAAELNWLADHLRWDVEEDLARVLGDVPARALGDVARNIAAAVRRFAQK